MQYEHVQTRNDTIHVDMINFYLEESICVNPSSEDGRRAKKMVETGIKIR